MDWHQEFFDFLAVITAITNGKQQYFEQADGMIYSRISGEYLRFEEMVAEYCNELKSLMDV